MFPTVAPPALPLPRGQDGGPRPGLLLFGDDEVSQHVEGVAVWVHRHDLATLLVNLKEPRIVQADYPHLRALKAS